MDHTTLLLASRLPATLVLKVLCLRLLEFASHHDSISLTTRFHWLKNFTVASQGSGAKPKTLGEDLHPTLVKGTHCSISHASNVDPSIALQFGPSQVAIHCNLSVAFRIQPYVIHSCDVLQWLQVL